MIHIRTSSEIERLRQCGAINANIHQKVRDALEPGISTQALNDLAALEIEAYGAKSSIRDDAAFPGDICISVNDEVGHGVPGSKQLNDGDVVKVDISIAYEGFHTDCAATHLVGHPTESSKRLSAATEAAMYAGIAKAQAGRRCSDISAAVATAVQAHGYSVMRHAFGHGVGTELHEAPSIANFGPPGFGPRLRPGMVIAIEPVVTSGSPRTLRKKDGWTDVTVDGSLGAHFEHTLVVTEGAPEILTRLSGDGTPNSWYTLPSGARVRLRAVTEMEKPQLVQLAARELDALLMAAWGRRVDPQELFDEGMTTLVMESAEGRTLGFCAFSETAQGLHVNTLAIDAAHHGRGLGRFAMEQVADIARARGRTSLSLCVQTNNNAAIRFYERLGYVICGSPYPNTWRMRKSV